MSPKHLKEVPANRVAVAPYNFVELPEKVVPARQPIPLANVYHPTQTHHTGWIDCQLETSSPLYIRCGLTSEQFLAGKEAKNLPEFFTHPGHLRPTLPGSSLRGMLRSLIEIISFGKLDQSRVNGKPAFTFRAVAANKNEDPLGFYKDIVKPQTVKAGYLVCEKDQWYVQPAVEIERKPFVWIRDDDIRTKLTGFISVEDRAYYPQYFTNISFGTIKIKNIRPFAESISSNPDQLQHKKGVLITSGNMAETGSGGGTSPRKNHCLIGQRNNKAPRLTISAEAIRIYRETLTEFQRDERAFSTDFGALQHDRCIFYCSPEPGQPITLFGHSPNFRIPYLDNKTNQAVTIADLIPERLRDAQLVDLADAIFGYVRPGKVHQEQAQAGRVFVSDALCKQQVEANIWLSPEVIIPQILSGPKLTTFQHYLTQNKSPKKDLKHYASNPGTETVIRGHKLYWHKGKLPDIEHPDPKKVSESQTTAIRPIKPGVKFAFKIQFDNLRDEELGALLWLLDVAKDETYRLSLGMGKPLGMGAIKIRPTLHLSDRRNRYSQLFSQTGWAKAETANPEHIHSTCLKAFEEYMLNHIGESDHPTTGKAKSLIELPRIRMLLAMLQWNAAPNIDKTRYMIMTIGPNEYIDRPVLPTPFQVLGALDRDTRKLHVSATVKPKPKASVPTKPESMQAEEQRQALQTPQLPQRTAGQIIDATITAINGRKVTYEIIEGAQRFKRSNEEHKLYQMLQVGQTVKVQIVSFNDDGTIKKVKLIT